MLSYNSNINYHKDIDVVFVNMPVFIYNTIPYQVNTEKALSMKDWVEIFLKQRIKQGYKRMFLYDMFSLYQENQPNVWNDNFYIRCAFQKF